MALAGMMLATGAARCVPANSRSQRGAEPARAIAPAAATTAAPAQTNIPPWLKCTVGADGIIVPCKDMDAFLSAAMDYLKNVDTRVPPASVHAVESATSSATMMSGYVPGQLDINGEMVPGFMKFGWTSQLRHWLNAFLGCYVYSGEAEWLYRAEYVARYMRYKLCTPANWAWSNAITPTKGDTIVEPDKVSAVGCCYLALYFVTGKEEYLGFAREVAENLRKNKTASGELLPSRVKGQDNKLVQTWISFRTYHVQFFEQMVKADPAYRQCYADILAWYKTRLANDEWGNWYEDVANDDPKYKSTEPLTAAAWWCAERSGSEPALLTEAIKAYTYVKNTLSANNEQLQLQSPVRILVEQPRYAVANTGSSIYFWRAAAAICCATGDDAYRREALNGLYWLTYHQGSNGHLPWGIRGPTGQVTDWGSNHPGVIDLILNDTIGLLPEVVPNGQNHIIRYSSIVGGVSYADGKVGFTARVPGETWLKLAFTPGSVTKEGTALRQVKLLSTSGEGWTYDKGTQVLKVSHGAGTVKITP